MIGFETLLDKPVFQALGWTLIHFIWEGALIAILYASASILLRRFSASVRYAAACAAMLMMLVAPAATMFVIGSESGTHRLGNSDVLTSHAAMATAYSPVRDEANARPPAQVAPPSQAEWTIQWAKERLPRAMPWLLLVWFAGVLILSLRFAGGLLKVRNVKRGQTRRAVLLWQDRLASLCQRLRVSRPVRIFESALVEVPAVIGWIRPAILLPASALTGLSTEQLEALLA